MSRRSEANNRFDAKNYDRISVIIPKGAKDLLKEKAAAEGLSVNRYIIEAVEQRSGLKLSLDGVLPWQKKEQEEKC